MKVPPIAHIRAAIRAHRIIHTSGTVQHPFPRDKWYVAVGQRGLHPEEAREVVEFIIPHIDFFGSPLLDSEFDWDGTLARWEASHPIDTLLEEEL